jgi:hypothetical protein
MSDRGVFENMQDLVHHLDSIHAALLLVCVWVTWQALLLFYRLTIHPLAKFPGPKLAAASYWYEYYYDVSKEGRYIWKIMELHEAYGKRTQRQAVSRGLTSEKGRLSE